MWHFSLILTTQSSPFTARSFHTRNIKYTELGTTFSYLSCSVFGCLISDPLIWELVISVQMQNSDEHRRKLFVWCDGSVSALHCRHRHTHTHPEALLLVEEANLSPPPRPHPSSGEASVHPKWLFKMSRAVFQCCSFTLPIRNSGCR